MSSGSGQQESTLGDDPLLYQGKICSGGQDQTDFSSDPVLDRCTSEQAGKLIMIIFWRSSLDDTQQSYTLHERQRQVLRRNHLDGMASAAIPYVVPLQTKLKPKPAEGLRLGITVVSGADNT